MHVEGTVGARWGLQTSLPLPSLAGRTSAGGGGQQGVWRLLLARGIVRVVAKILEEVEGDLTYIPPFDHHSGCNVGSRGGGRG